VCLSLHIFIYLFVACAHFTARVITPKRLSDGPHHFFSDCQHYGSLALCDGGDETRFST
jgi:hypothetical protein